MDVVLVVQKHGILRGQQQKLLYPLKLVLELFEIWPGIYFVYYYRSLLLQYNREASLFVSLGGVCIIHGLIKTHHHLLKRGMMILGETLFVESRWQNVPTKWESIRVIIYICPQKWKRNSYFCFNAQQPTERSWANSRQVEEEEFTVIKNQPGVEK